MKKVFITGAEGFVGRYLIEELKPYYEVIGGHFLQAQLDCKSYRIDVTDRESIERVMESEKPDIICHLAAQSSGGVSYRHPMLTYRINVMGTLNVLDAARNTGKDTTVFIPSSSDVYGAPQYLPIDEKHPLHPINPYSSSKMIIEQIAGQYSMHFDVNVIVSRSFNHTGPGQDDKFFVPTMIKKIRQAKDGDTITAGNLAIIRDFLDVRDVVRAYRLILEIEPGVYNIAGNNPVMLGDITEHIIKISGKHINISIDPSKVRKNENLRLFGSYEKLNKETGWEPEIDIVDTLREMYET